MLVELQIDVEAFKKAFREQLRKGLACELTEGTFENTPYVITGYTVTDTKVRRSQTLSPVCIHTGTANVTTSRQVKKPQLVQIVVAHLSWVKDLIAANTAKAPSIPLTLPLVFDLSMDTCGNMRQFCLNFVGLEGIDAALSQKLGQKITSRRIDLPVDRVIAGYMPAKVGLINSHLTLVQGDKTLAVRMEFWEETWGSSTGDPVHPVTEWEAFYTGTIPDHLQRAESRDGWSIFMDQLALTQFVRQTISDSVSGKSDLIVTRQPTAEWYDHHVFPESTANHVHANMEIKKLNACWCFTEDLDVTAEIDADVLISVPKDNTVRLDVYVNVSPDFFEATCCVLTAAAFWPFLGLGLAVKGKIKDWEYWLGFLPFAALVGAILGISDAGSDVPPPKDFTKDEDNDNHVYKEQQLNLPNDPSFGKLTLRGAEPMNDTSSLHVRGLYLFGNLETIVLPQPELEDPELEPFGWGKSGHCSRRVAASTNFRLHPTDPSHWALLQVCNVRVLDDPLNVFKLRVERVAFTDIFLQVDFWAMSAHYWEPQYRYPCRLLIKTVGGVRIVTFPLMANLTQEQFGELYHQVQLEFVNECYLPRHRLFEELEWPIEVLIEDPGLHNWTVRAAGLEPGDQLNLVDERGGVVGRFTANRNGTLLVNALGRLQGAQPVLTLRRGASGRTALPGALQTAMSLHSAVPEDRYGRHSTPDNQGDRSGHGNQGESMGSEVAESARYIDAGKNLSRGIMIRQTQLVERGRIGLIGKCLALSGDARNGQPRLIVITEDLVEAFDVRDASSPSQIATWRAEGVRGALSFNEELLFWGKLGIWSAADGSRARTKVLFAPCVGGPSDEVRGAVMVRDRLFLLRSGALCVYGLDLCEQSRHNTHGAEQIAAAGDFVVVRGPDGLHLFDGRAPMDCLPEQTALTPLRGVSHIETLPFPFGCNAFYARGGEGTFLLEVSPTGELDRIAEYESGAWFEGIARVGRTLAFPSIDRRTVRLVEAARSAKSS